MSAFLLWIAPARYRPSIVRFARFGAVGVSGLLINTLALAALVSGFGMHYLIAVVVATQASTTWNFFLSERWVFTNPSRHYSVLARFTRFWTMNNAALVLRGPMVWLLTDKLGVVYLASNLISLIVMMLARYSYASQVIWSAQRTPLESRTAVAEISPESEPSARSEAGTESEIPTRSAAGAESEPALARPRWLSRSFKIVVLTTIAAPAILLRIAHLDSLGFNSDEAVYAGQAASIVGDETLIQYFPIFRAHPLLFQTTLSVLYRFFGVSTFSGRLLSVAFGLATIAVTYKLGSVLADRRVGAVAALLLAVMPYHVIVTRQVLLDGPMVFFATSALYLLARFVQTGKVGWLYAAAGGMGLTILTNERSVVLLGGVYLFFALVSNVKVRFRDLVLSFGIVVITVMPYPLSVFFSGKSTTGEQFLAWQLFRRANHGWWFYPTHVPAAMGYVTVAAALAGLFVMLRSRSWPGVLLVSWMAVPLVFFEIWPVKGFQYLLTLAPVIAVAAAFGLCQIPDTVRRFRLSRWPRSGVRVIAIVLVVAVAMVTSWYRVTPSAAGESFLAGSGGVPGGREAGMWVAENVPEGSQLLAVGPSMANIIQWYGDRKTFGLSVSPNPLHRNPVYEPIVNPDLLLRNGDLHYLIWDSFSASRSEFFSNKLLRFAERYNGRIIHQEVIEVTTDDGESVEVPVIVIYEVRP